MNKLKNILLLAQVVLKKLVKSLLVTKISERYYFTQITFLSKAVVVFFWSWM